MLPASITLLIGSNLGDVPDAAVVPLGQRVAALAGDCKLLAANLAHAEFARSAPRHPRSAR